MSKVPLHVGGSPAGTPPPVDPGSDSDEDRYSLDEPQFVIHAVDDDRRLPPALPIQHPPPPAPSALDLEVARLERLRYFLILPQALLCSWTVVLGILMICLANTAEAQTNLVWVVACSVLVMLSALASLVLSYLAVYHYDDWPGLNRWLYN